MKKKYLSILSLFNLISCKSSNYNLNMNLENGNNQKRGSINKPYLKFIKQYMNSLITNNYNASIDAICWMQY